MLPGGENFPRDPDLQIGMVLARDLEIDKLRDALKTAQAMLFGPKSERLSAIMDGQIGLDLGDLATDVTPMAANDEPAQPAGLRRDARRPSRRNIGALLKHLPRGVSPEPSGSLDYVVSLDGPPQSLWRSRGELGP